MSGLLKPQTGDALSEFAVTVAVPLLLFRTMAGAAFDGNLPWALWTTYFSAVAVAWVAGHFTIVHFFGRDARAGVVAGLSTSFSNLVLLGIPFMLGVFGQQGFEVLSLIVSVHLPIMMGMSILLFALVGPQGRQCAFNHPRVSDKAFLQSTDHRHHCGLLWRFSGLEMPALGTRFVDALANVAGPVALFSMGLGLRRFGISGDVRPAIVIAGLKLFLMPAVALGVALLIGLPVFSAQIAVVAAGAALRGQSLPDRFTLRHGTGTRLQRDDHRHGASPCFRLRSGFPCSTGPINRASQPLAGAPRDSTVPRKQRRRPRCFRRPVHFMRQANFIDGAWVEADSGQTIDVVNPANGQKIGTVPRSGTAETRRAIEAAETAFHSWKKTSADHRAKLLRRLHDAIMDNQDALAELLVMEQGKSFAEANGEVGMSAAYILWYAEEGRPGLWRRGAVALGGPPHSGDQGTGRRHRRDHAVEFSLLNAGTQAWPGACLRLHRDCQTGVADALFRARLGCSVRRGRISERRGGTS